MSRRGDIDEFYQVLGELKRRSGGFRHLSQCDGRMAWPLRGVYFFFEPGECREDGVSPRVVRVGTHALKAGSRSTLWGRLSQHRGNLSGTHAGGGNHRGSVFRRHVGDALIRRGLAVATSAQTWGQGNSANRAVQEMEHVLEQEVSRYIRSLPFLVLGVDDEPGPDSDRGVIEPNAIALLSNYRREVIDAPSESWLGMSAANPRIRESGLWNVDWVDGEYDPRFLSVVA